MHVVLHNLTIHMKNKRKYGKFTESRHSQRYSLNYHQKRWINGRKCGDNSREKLAIKLDLNWLEAHSKESSKMRKIDYIQEASPPIFPVLFCSGTVLQKGAKKYKKLHYKNIMKKHCFWTQKWSKVSPLWQSELIFL